MPTPLRQGNVNGWTLTIDRTGAGGGIFIAHARHAGTLGAPSATYGGQALEFLGSSLTINDGTWDWRLDFFRASAAVMAAATDNDFDYDTPTSRCILFAELYTGEVAVPALSAAAGNLSSAAPTSGPINGVAGGRIISAVSSQPAATKGSDGFTLLLENFNPEEERLNVAALNTTDTSSQQNTYTMAAGTFVGRAILVTDAANPGIRITDIRQPNSDAQVANATGVYYELYDQEPNAAEDETELGRGVDATITSGTLVIDNDLVGAVAATGWYRVKWLASGELRTVEGPYVVVNLSA